MKTSEKLNILQEIARDLEYYTSTDYDTPLSWAQSCKYRFDEEKYSDENDEENKTYRDEIDKEYKEYCEKQAFKKEVIESLFKGLAKFI